MSLAQELLPKLKLQVNAADFEGDDALLETTLRRAIRQILGVCNLSRDDLYDEADDMLEEELECGIPADIAGAVLELAAAMYRYGEAYSESSYRFTPSFEMALSRYRKHFNPYEEAEEE